MDLVMAGVGDIRIQLSLLFSWADLSMKLALGMCSAIYEVTLKSSRLIYLRCHQSAAEYHRQTWAEILFYIRS